MDPLIRQALDDALKGAVAKIYGVLLDNLVSGCSEEEATNRFLLGVKLAVSAHALACGKREPGAKP